MYAKSTRSSAKREVQKDRSAKRDDQIARPRRAQVCERSELRPKRAMRMCPLSGQIFLMLHYVTAIKNRSPYVCFFFSLRDNLTSSSINGLPGSSFANFEFAPQTQFLNVFCFYILIVDEKVSVLCEK